MSKPGRHRRKAGKIPRRVRGNAPLLAGLALVIGVAVGAVWWWNHSQSAGRIAAFQKLEGRWQRADGGYLLDIRGVDAGGKLTAAYLNPRPINVGRAEAAMEGGALKVFVQLSDINYPGSTYRLTYDSAGDRLRGTYFQAALRETYEVEFARVKP